MSEPTHATLATFRMDLSREAEQREGLRRFLVPSVMSSPGVVTGCWTLDREQSESIVLITFDSRPNAESFATNVRANSANQNESGVELISMRIVEVAASASMQLGGPGT